MRHQAQRSRDFSNARNLFTAGAVRASMWEEIEPAVKGNHAYAKPRRECEERFQKPLRLQLAGDSGCRRVCRVDSPRAPQGQSCLRGAYSEPAAPNATQARPG